MNDRNFQMSVADRECGARSLLIVDEFGKGTAKVDGLALLAASLNALLLREQSCPHVLVSTHYLNIKEFIFNTPLVRFLVSLPVFAVVRSSKYINSGSQLFTVKAPISRILTTTFDIVEWPMTIWKG